MTSSQGACRFCATPLTHSFCDLGMTPLSNSYLPYSELEKGEKFFPLHAYVCDQCLLVQVKDYELPENIFGDYAYFSSFSDSWLSHCKGYVEKIAERLELNAKSQVVEIASNDGYLLQFFKEKGIAALGIEPAANVALVSQNKGIPTRVQFFNSQTAQDLVSEGIQADLLIGNNVLAHVPGLNDFVKGLKILLAPKGVITMEFPHLLRLILSNQFDTIYHEHFSYFSFFAVSNIFAAHGLKIFDCDELSTHGGSLRIYATHMGDEAPPFSESIARIQEAEKALGLHELSGYRNFFLQIQKLRSDLLQFFLNCQQQGKTVVGYGAPAKGNTLLNFCGIRSQLMPFTVDRSPHKQGRFLPGTHIPVQSVEAVREAKPDFLFILPWNLKNEIMEQMAFIRDWGGQFVIPIPNLQVIS